MSFRDHFSGAAADYAAYRPRYPAALFAWLADLAPRRDVAWDAGTGSGQAATGLAAYFERVIATDASAAQLARAEPHPRVEYRVAIAEQSDLPDGSVALVTAATALHWFDRGRFWREARRVLAEGGAIAVWSYGLMEVTPAVDAVVTRLYRDIVGPFWPFERRMVEQGYRTIEFPFEEVPAPDFAMEARWTLVHLTGYLGTWSAVLRYREARREDPVALVSAELQRAWGDPEEPRPVRWPLALRAGRAGPAPASPAPPPFVV
jgi:SAM-dependent methyltransferase